MKILKLINTVKYLKFIQIYYRLYYLFLKPSVKQTVFKTQLRYAAQNWENAIPKPISMLSPTQFLFLNYPGQLNTAEDWNSNQQEKLWLYNLHYFDDLNAENASDRVEWHKNTIQKWIDQNPYAKGNGWEPYPNSLRIVNWVKWSLQGHQFTEQQLQSLVLQAEHLSKTVEWHILANHLFANAKALIFAGLFFDTIESKKWLAQGLKIYHQEIDEQVLADGANFELTPMYHAIFLEDLLDLYQLITRCYAQTGLIDVEHLKTKIIKMLDWLKYMSHPDGEISFFNDATFGIASTYENLKIYAEKLNIFVPVSESQDRYLKQSGYIVVEKPSYKFIMDVAEVGPSYQPGHAHADTLSFELSILGSRFIVNSGISQYGLGSERLHQRSTAAHNTIEIDQQNSSEIWSGFRVARRVSPKLDHINFELGQITEFSASYKSLEHVVHRRAVRFVDDQIILKDDLHGQFNSAVSYFYFHPDVTINKAQDNSYVCDLMGHTIEIQLKGDIEANLLNSFWHPEFGKSVPNNCLKINLLSNNYEILISCRSLGF
ncbi:heparinase II/III family protein [Acinetobacter sp. ANC 4177]|uniref:heparinase II/III family protein n=1 Tax=Acinetobacter sp. ANC 4177 TaxID=2529838 RepID=UPI00103F56D0|nr:heparinase II/III family protein [Acinetobacter sp. ANC 4177]TCB73701.1 alginate lyase family protein [Acinetobacter sp. ANC 4177]